MGWSHVGRTLAIGLCGFALWAADSQVATAKVEVTETFDIGMGTRFDSFQGNNPAPYAIPTLTSPDDMTSQNMGFGPELLDYSAVKTNQFGLTTTNFVGQANGTSGEGEFGGQFNWLNYGYGADTNLGGLTLGSATQEDPIKIQAKLLLQDVGLGNDETVTIGYFNENLGLNPETSTLNPVGDADDMRRGDGFGLQPHTTISAGVGFISDGRFFLYMLGADSPVFDFRSAATPVAPGVGIIDIDLDVFCFECESVGTGVITGTINGNPVGFSRIASSDNTLDAFGIGQAFLNRQDPPLHWRRTNAYVDDVTYSVEVDGGIDNADPMRFEYLEVVGNFGDYNGNGEVDAADYTVWRDHLGDTGVAGTLMGDGTGDDALGIPDGDVDEFDFLYWRQEFGNVISGAGAGSTLANVPEPASGVLLTIGFVSLCGMRRRLAAE
jgi:hypothetical protein